MFSVALHESTDILDIAQLAIFISGVDETRLSVTKEFLGLLSLLQEACYDINVSRLNISRLATGVQATVSDFWPTWVFRSPFTVKPSDQPVDLQLEIIDLQCDSDLKTKFALVSLYSFYQHLIPGYPKVTALLQKFCACLGRHIFVNKCS